MTDNIGALEKERQRQEFWLARDLPDPVRVEAEERATERLTGKRFTSPKRAQLDAFFADNPQYEPKWWKGT